MVTKDPPLQAAIDAPPVLGVVLLTGQSTQAARGMAVVPPREYRPIAQGLHEALP